MISSSIIVISGIVIVLAVTIFFGFIFYDNVLDYHNYKDNKTFVSGDSKYTFYYDKRTKTLIILKGSDVDAVFVDGIKDKGEK